MSKKRKKYYSLADIVLLRTMLISIFGSLKNLLMSNIHFLFFCSLLNIRLLLLFYVHQGVSMPHATAQHYATVLARADDDWFFSV